MSQKRIIAVRVRSNLLMSCEQGENFPLPSFLTGPENLFVIDRCRQWKAYD